MEEDLTMYIEERAELEKLPYTIERDMRLGILNGVIEDGYDIFQ